MQKTENLNYPPHLKIVWDLQESIKESKGLTKKTWMRSCRRLGRSLIVGRGPWGFGAFSGFSCWMDEKKISGKPKGEAWTLYYTEKQGIDGVSLSITDHKKSVVTEVSYAWSPYSIFFLADKEFADLVAYRILDDLPFLAYALPKNLQKSEGFKGRYPYANPKSGRKYALIPPPKNLTAFQLDDSAEEEVYRAHVLGEINQLKIDVEDKQDKEKSKKRKKIFVHWQPTAELRLGSKKVWIHNTEGRGKLSDVLDRAINDAHKKLMKAEDDVFSYIAKGANPVADSANGYIAVRYGRQVYSLDPLLRKTTFVGFLLDIKGGPLKGVKFYLDRVPRKELEQNNRETYLEWSRYVVGRSFSLNIGFIVDRIDITPKLGIWNFHAKLPQTYDDDGLVASVGTFDMDRAVAPMIEVGAEWSNDWYSIRPWYGYEMGMAASKYGTKKVMSNRFGLDAFWTAGPSFGAFGFNFRSAVLLFLNYEGITMTNGSDATMENASGELLELYYNGIYAGGGIGLSW